LTESLDALNLQCMNLFSKAPKAHTLIEVKATGQIISARLADQHITESAGNVAIETLSRDSGKWQQDATFPKKDVKVLL